MDVASAVIGRGEGFEATLMGRRALQVRRTGDQLGDGIGERVDDVA